MSHFHWHYWGLLCTVLLLPIHMLFAAPMAEPKKGFGMGLLGGALAGAAVSKVLSSGSNHGSAATTPNSAVAHSTIIDNGPIMANGCYHQTTTTPDPQDARKFEQTVNLICPSSVATPIIAAAPVNVQPQISEPFFVAAVLPPQEPVVNAEAAVTPNAADNSIAYTPLPIAPVQQQQQPPQVQQTIAENAAQPGQQQVFVLTKKVGFYETPTPTRRTHISSGSKRQVSPAYWIALMAAIIALL